MISLDGRDVRVTVRVSARATRCTLRLAAGDADPVLTFPARAAFDDALDFLGRHRGWLAERLHRRPHPVPFAAGAVVPLRGRPHLVVHEPEARGTVWVDGIGDGERPFLCVAGKPEHLARRLRDHLARTAHDDLVPAVERHAARLGVTPTRIRIKDTRSRWGSCTATGELSFSWRVVMAPPLVLDYLAAHEVAHLGELNHSARFWRLVETCCPDMEAGRGWLKQHGAELHAYGTRR